MLYTVAEITPDLFPFIHRCYRETSFLRFAERNITSARGLPQGEPLGPALFCLSMDCLIWSLSTDYNCWYRSHRW